MKHWYTMVPIPRADTRAQKGDKVNSSRPLSERIMIVSIVIIVGVVTFVVASAFSFESLDRHVFQAGVSFEDVVASTETIRGE